MRMLIQPNFDFIQFADELFECVLPSCDIGA